MTESMSRGKIAGTVVPAAILALACMAMSWSPVAGADGAQPPKGAGADSIARLPVVLKWRFEKGKTFYQEMTTETKQETDVMGKKNNQTQKQTSYLSWTPERQNPDGSWVVKQRTDAVKMDLEIGGRRIIVDSMKGKPAANGEEAMYLALVGTELRFTIRPDMSTAKIEGREAYIEKLEKASPGTTKLLRRILNEGVWKQCWDPVFGVLPNKPLRQGESWKRTSALDMGIIGGSESTYRYTFAGWEGPLVRITEQAEAAWVPSKESGKAKAPFQLQACDLKSTRGNGVILFDVVKGRIVRSESNIQLAGQMTIEIGGEQSHVKMVQTQKRTTLISDSDPLKPLTPPGAPGSK
jgi:Family of unknown function (DUF6263)